LDEIPEGRVYGMARGFVYCELRRPGFVDERMTRYTADGGML
jgi:hypothetical protein